MCMLDGSGFRLKQSCIAGGQTSKSVHCKGDSALASPKLASPNVVKKLAYFNAHLNGIWTETDILELNLPEPCCLEDFLVLIQHLYSSQYAPVARLYSPGQNNNFHELLERILECAMGLSCDQFRNFVIRCSSLTEREPLEARVRHHKASEGQASCEPFGQAASCQSCVQDTETVASTGLLMRAFAAAAYLHLSERVSNGNYG